MSRRCGAGGLRWTSLVTAVIATLSALQAPSAAAIQGGDASADHTHHHSSTATGSVVMNENRDRLPRDCRTISRDYAFTIRAGRDHARGRPGALFGFNRHELEVEPCSRVEIIFVNEDEVRHQWMVHGLPAYLYPAGMFHLEAPGKTRVRGTFIVPGDDRTYLIHCDMAQHMEKGMRGQLVVGRGSGDLWGVPGVSDDFNRAAYLPGFTPAVVAGALTLAALLTWVVVRRRSDES